MTYENDGMMRMPNPVEPRSGWTDRSPSYASGSAAGPAPEGMTYIPQLNTYVENDVAAQLGLGSSGNPRDDADNAPHSTALNPAAIPEGGGIEILPEDLDEMTDDELEALQDQLEINAEREPTLSPTLDEIAACFGNDFENAVDRMVVGTNEETLEALSEATGLDPQTALTLLETTVMEVAPIASEHIGSGCWSSLVYAAAQTDDPFARRVVSDVVTGRLHPTRLANAYKLWYDSLPDAEG